MKAERKRKFSKPEDAMVCEEVQTIHEVTRNEEDVLNMKRDAEGRIIPKQPRIDAKGYSRITARTAERDKLLKLPSRPSPTKK